MTVTLARPTRWVVRCDHSQHCGSQLEVHAPTAEDAATRAVTAFAWTRRDGTRLLCRRHSTKDGEV